MTNTAGFLVKPPKPVEAMTDAELDAWLDSLVVDVKKTMAAVEGSTSDD